MRMTKGPGFPQPLNPCVLSPGDPLYIMAESSKTAKADDARPKAQTKDSVISTIFYW